MQHSSLRPYFTPHTLHLTPYTSHLTPHSKVPEEKEKWMPFVDDAMLVAIAINLHRVFLSFVCFVCLFVSLFSKAATDTTSNVVAAAAAAAGVAL